MTMRLPAAAAAIITAVLALSACAAPGDPAPTVEPTATAAPSSPAASITPTPSGSAEAAGLESPAPTASSAVEPPRADDPVGFVERWAADGFASLRRAPEYFCESSLTADAQMDYDRLEQDAHRDGWTHTIGLDEYSSERFPAVDVVFSGPNHTVLHIIGLSRTDSGYCISSITIPGVSARD